MSFHTRWDAATRTLAGTALLLMGTLCAQTPSTPTAAPQQGGCTQTDASGKQVFVPNCGLAPGAAAPAPTEKTKSAARAFPFPGESPSETPDAPPGQPAASTGTSTPAGQRTSDTSPSGKFPFPGGDAGSTAPGLKDAGSSGDTSDSSSSSSSSSGSRASGMGGLDPLPNGPLPGEDDDPAAKAAAARHGRPKPVATMKLTPDQRELEDLQIAGYYQNDGNFRGAYLRATDAVSITDSDPNAHFALAEAARHLGKLDEAEKQYKRCLELDPIEKEKKAAQKALKQMSGG